MVPHTVVVDFAVALLLTSVVCDALAALAEEDELRIVAYWTLLFGCGAAVLSVLSGFAAARAADPSGEALRMVQWHRNAGIATLVAGVPATVWRFRAGARPPTHLAYWLLKLVAVLALLTTAYLGGVAVFRHGVGVAL